MSTKKKKPPISPNVDRIESRFPDSKYPTRPPMQPMPMPPPGPVQPMPMAPPGRQMPVPVRKKK